MNTYETTAHKKLMNFLRRHHAVTDTFTHTSIDKPMGKFNIPEDKEDEFYNLYYQACFVEKEDLYLTEKPNIESSPFRCDLDFRMKQADLERHYTNEDINHIVQTFMTEIENWTSFENEQGESNVSQRLCFVFEKENPRFKSNDDMHNDTRIVKDGVHLVWPYLVSDGYLQEIVRAEVCKKVSLDHLNLTNALDDVFDPQVIFRNNWQMYGSKKPNCTPYKLTRILKAESTGCVEIDIDEFTAANGGERVLVHQMKIRRPENEVVQILESKRSEFNERKSNLQTSQKYALVNRNVYDLEPTELSTKDLELVQNLVSILNPERADSREKWIELGWCLHNIHNVDDSLLDTWIAFSKQSSSYAHEAEEACTREWNNSITGGLQIGTLHFWAREDNHEKYQVIMREFHSEMLSEQVNNFTEYGIATAMYKLYSKLFICVSVKDKRWFRFDGIRWKISDNGIHLRRLISTEMYKYLTSNYMSRLSSSSDSGDESKQDDLDYQLEQRKKMSSEMEKARKKFQKLQSTSFKSNIMKECIEVFHDYAREFCDRLDANINIIGFENGVYELDSGVFRNGRAEDYLTMSTKINYTEYTWDDPLVEKVLEFFSKIYTNNVVREYVLTLLATCLSGSVKEEKFPIWTGSGSNGKSKIIELLKGATGDYYCSIPVTILTRKRADAGNANPHMAQTRGKRILVFSEPDAGQKINVGLMKELSGGDPIVVRQLFERPIEFKPQFHMILVCNEMPQLPPDDEAVWRRVRVTQHLSKFTDNPSPDNHLEFEIDRTITDQMKDWYEPFMWILLQYYKKYLTHGLHEPNEVLKYTNDYQLRHDHVANFLQERVKETKQSTDCLMFLELYDEYKFYVRENFKGVPQKNKTEFMETITKKLGAFSMPSSSNSQKQGWVGYKFVPHFQINNSGAMAQTSEGCLLSS